MLISVASFGRLDPSWLIYCRGPYKQTRMETAKGPSHAKCHGGRNYMNCSLNSLKEGYIGNCIGEYYKGYEGGSHRGLTLISVYLGRCCSKALHNPQSPSTRHPCLRALKQAFILCPCLYSVVKPRPSLDPQELLRRILLINSLRAIYHFIGLRN